MVYLATYIGRGSLANMMIRFWTRSNASHSEIKVGGSSFSSSIMDGGVRSKRINFDDENWELLPLPWVRESDVVQYFAQTKDIKYGWWDLICRQFMHLPFSDGKGQFCSEWCAEAIGLKSGREFSPDTLRSVCMDIVDILERA